MSTSKWQHCLLRLPAERLYLYAFASGFLAGSFVQNSNCFVGGDWRNCYICVPSVSDQTLSLLLCMQDLAVSSGSACTSASLEPSYVLRALGVEEDMAHTSIRFGLGRFTTEAEVDRAVALTVQHVEKLREMSPLWEMVQEGIDIKSIQWSQH